MPTVTALKKQIKYPNRVNIFLDGQFAFGLDLETALKYHLSVNKQITEEQITEILKQGEIQRVYENAVKYFSYRPRSEKELDDWFKKKNIGSTVIELIKPKLINLNLINDLEFTKWWVSQRQTFRPRGKKVLFMELLQKGIIKPIINQVLDNLGEQTEQIKILGQKKMKQLAKYPLKEHRPRLTRYLLTKGYNYDQIRNAVDELLS